MVADQFFILPLFLLLNQPLYPNQPSLFIHALHDDLDTLGNIIVVEGNGMSAG